MSVLRQNFQINFQYNIYFTEHVFSLQNAELLNMLKTAQQPGFTQRLLFVIDEQVQLLHPSLTFEIDEYFKAVNTIQVVREKIVIAGGEIAKNDLNYFNQIIEAINYHKIDRHSYVIAIGGGSVLDLAGYAAAVAHRGLKHIRIPTTVLSQADSGVGVKNGINYLGKKNFLGTFSPPVAVFNDYHFLTTLPDRQWVSGISEAIKVALIKDDRFFEWLEEMADKIMQYDKAAMQCLIERCADLHIEHIGGGDPFELGSSRPLDFGHWSAHKIEQLSAFSIIHGEAVSIGIAIDSMYSFLVGSLTKDECIRILNLLLKFKLPIFNEILVSHVNIQALLGGLQEFSEHLGGRLTIMLLNAIGQGYEVHEMNAVKIEQALSLLQKMYVDQERYELAEF
ncbi:MAG TPA: 3-dehydroquinate synthase [Pseudosphingobacterium sp.]|nr:3-dehydroquinate synthase [Pseudosphingobacterium sp.]